MQGARQAAHQFQGRSFIGSMCSRRHAFKDGVHEPVCGGRCAGCGAGCPPASFSTSIEDLYGDVCSRWHACHHGVRQKGRVWGRRPTSVLLHQRDQRVQRGGPARDVQGAEGVLGGGHHQHGRLDAGHVVDWVVPRHLGSPDGRGPCSASPPANGLACLCGQSVACNSRRTMCCGHTDSTRCSRSSEHFVLHMNALGFLVKWKRLRNLGTDASISLSLPPAGIQTVCKPAA